MGLFMNDEQHPGLFRNSSRLVDNNQVEYRSDYFSEAIREQQTANQLIQRTIQALKNAQNRSNHRQIQDWKIVGKQLGELKELHSQHEQIEKQVMDWLQKLEARHTELHVTVTDKQLGIQNLIDQINTIRQSQVALEQQLQQMTGTNDDVFNQLQQMGRTNEQLVEKLNAQHTMQQTIANQMSTMEATQNELVNRVDSQEGLMDKGLRQLDHLRSILFERTHYLEDKIEKVSEYFNKIYTKS